MRCRATLALLLFARCSDSSVDWGELEDHRDCLSDDECAIGLHCDTKTNECYRRPYVVVSGPRCSAQLTCTASQRCSPVSHRCVSCENDQLCLERSDEIEGATLIYDGVWVTGSTTFAVGAATFDEKTSYSLLYPAGMGEVLSGRMFSVRGRSATDVWAVGEVGAIYRYDGQRWAPAPGGMSVSDLRDIWFDETGAPWIVGFGNTVLHGIAEGRFEWRQPPGTHDWYGIGGTAHDDLWIGGSKGGLFHYDGTNWTPADLPGLSNVVVRSIHAVTSDDVWAAGCLTSACSGGVVLHRVGGQWQVDRSVPNSGLYRVFALDKDHVWVAGVDVVLARDTGVWKTLRQKSGALYRSLFATRPDDLWFAGSEPTNDLLTNRGVLWHLSP